MASEATYPLFSPMTIDAALEGIPDAWEVEDFLAGNIPPDPQSAGDTSYSTIAGMRQEVLYLAGGGGLACPTTAATGTENLPEQQSWFGCPVTGGQGLITYSVGNPGPYTGSGTAMQQINGDLTHPEAGLAVPESIQGPYSTGDTSCPSTAATDTGSSSLDLEVNAGAGMSQSSGGRGSALTEAAVHGSSKRKKLVCGSSSQRSTPPEFSLVELQAGFVQMDPSSADIKPPTRSTDPEIISFLRREGRSMPRGEEVNLSFGEQDGMAPKAVRSYVTTVEMMPDQKTNHGYWKEKEVKTVRSTDESDPLLRRFVLGVKRTWQFHKYDDTKTNWFMEEYIPTNFWGIDMYMEPLRFRVVYKGAEISVSGKPTSRTVKHRLRGPDDRVVKGESPVWQHFIKIYDRHPELEGSKVVYAVCCHCEGVLKADTKNGTNSLTTHCDRTCPVKNKNQQPRSSR